MIDWSWIMSDCGRKLVVKSSKANFYINLPKKMKPLKDFLQNVLVHCDNFLNEKKPQIISQLLVNNNMIPNFRKKANV